MTNQSRRGFGLRRRVRIALAAAACLLAACSGGVTTSASLEATAGRTSGFAVGGSTEVFVITGPEGGPFDDIRRTYTLTNTSQTESLTWAAQATQEWLVFSRDAGELAPGASAEVTVLLDMAQASQLKHGEYPADIMFRPSGSGAGDIYLAFLLRVLPALDGAPLWITPEGDSTVTGEIGGPFDSEEVFYRLTNEGAQPLEWSLAVDQPWLVLPDAWSGSLSPGQTTEVAVGLDPGATGTMPSGTHRALAQFTVTSGPPGNAQLRAVHLNLSSGNSGGEGERVTEGLATLYDFEQPGSSVLDASGVEPFQNLSIDDARAVEWLPGKLRIVSPTRLASQGPATKIIEHVQSTGALTIEAWISPQNLVQDGPARIVTISNGVYARDVTLSQGLWSNQPSDTFNVRLRSTATDENGMPHLATDAGTAQLGLQHVVYTRSASGLARIYLDGVLSSEGQIGGSLTNWEDDFDLALANELGGDERPWLGDLHLVAVYGRDLSSGEVEQNFEAGPGDAQSAHLVATPTSNFYTSAPEGEEPLIDSMTYLLENPGPEPVDWEANLGAPWVFVQGVNAGVLEPGATHEVVITIDGDAVVGFGEGIYETKLTLRNQTNGIGTTSRDVQLIITGEGGGEQEWVSEVSQYGITWHFQQPVLSGKFVTGDTWIVGPVTVTHVSPSPTSKRNGSMLNPAPKDNGPASAFDDRVPYADMSLAVSYPVTLSGGDALVSSISHSENPFPVTDVIGDSLTNFSWVRAAAVLTVVDAPMPSTAFRPPYAYAPSVYPSGKKPIFDSGNLRWDKLPTGISPTGGSLAFHPDSSLTPLEQVAKFFERPWILCTRDWPGRQTHPSENMPNYHREVYNVIADASLLLMTDASPAQKHDLMVGFIQLGIDSMGCGMLGGADSSLHKWPTVFAGVMLDDAGMSGGSPHSYRTDYMTYYPHEKLTDVESDIVPASEGWTGANVLFRQDPVATPVTEHEHFHPTEWQTKNTSSGGGKKREAYRRSNSYTWPGVALAARMMDAADEWDHPQFFHYVDRWMTEDDVENMAYLEDLFNYSLYIGGQGAGSSFVKQMWLQYRSSF